ncbi:DMT family transporter [Aliiglaciecola sp.]|nr:DMT family transporter [Aliiglaciecola sp.]
MLFAALLHASWNGLLKHSQNRLRSLFINRLIAVPIGLALIFYLPSIDGRAWPYLLLASAIHLVYFWSLLRAYKHGDFSQVYPISRGIAPLLILLVGVIFLSESVSSMSAFGIVLISAGIMLLAKNNQKHNRKPIAFALITGCCIASYTLVSGTGVRLTQSFLVYVAWLEAMSGLLFASFVLLMHYRQLDIKNISWPVARIDMLSGVMATGGFAVALWAMTKIPIAAVAALRETSVVFAALIGWLILGESYGKGRVMAAVLVFLGVVALVSLE